MGFLPLHGPGLTRPFRAKFRNFRVPPWMAASEGGHDVWVLRSSGMNLEKSKAPRGGVYVSLGFGVPQSVSNPNAN